MKKLLAVILCCVITLSFSACSGNSSDKTETAQTSSVHTTISPTEATLSVDTEKQLTDLLHTALEDFKGIVYLTQNGNLIYSQSIGKDEQGNDLTVETPMYIGSLSKQFCATAVMILKEQGKLNLDDTLDKFFPEYTYGKNVTVKNLLTMRSGVPEMVTEVEGHSADKTESENITIIKDWIFSNELDFEPDTEMAYSNTNYFLLANIIEAVSDQHYNDFIRENIFNPLGMDNSGFVNEVKDNAFFSGALTYDTFTAGEDAEGLTKGAGDIVTTAPDMDKWMTGLKSGKIISQDSYNEMTEDHSPDFGAYYGYGLSGMNENGFGHIGGIGNYISVNRFDTEYGYNLFAVTTESQNEINSLPVSILNILLRGE